MTSNTASGISFEGYSSIYNIKDSHEVCIIMDSQNSKASVPTQKDNATQKYKTDTKTSNRALHPKKPFINVGLLIIILLVIIATVLVLEVGLKFNILSMSPKTYGPLSEIESNNIAKDRAMLTHSAPLVNSTTPATTPPRTLRLQTIPIGRLRNTTQHCFKCKNGNCVSYDFFCDGEDNCGDNSDEYACDCGDAGTEYICAIEGSSDVCVNQAWLCDGDADCPDGDDETNCDT